MTNIFNFNTLKVSLKKDTRSLLIALNRPQKNNALNLEMLFELESIFSWCASHIEINSILLTSTSDFFSQGIDHEDALVLGEEKFIKLSFELQKLVYSMFFLPQTIIVDVKKGSSFLGSELLLGADLRVADEDTNISFNHLQMGVSPSSGGVGFLSALVSRNYAKNWLLSGKSISKNELLESGLFIEVSHNENKTEDLLQKIASQSPVARIQMKRSLLEPIMEKLDQTLNFESRFMLASLSSHDFKKALSGDKNFLSPLKMLEALKNERVSV